MAETDYYTTLHRSMFARISEVGAKPFLLFQYYLTWQTAPDGIKPSLKRIALDMRIVDKKGKPQISAVSHLKKVLLDKGWIEEKDGEILITLTEKVEKISTPEAEPVEKISSEVEKISIDDLRKSQVKLRKSQLPIYRNEKQIIKDKEIILKEKNIKKENSPFDLLAETFPDENFSSTHIGFVESAVSNSELDQRAWRSTVTLYEQNYDPERNRYIPTKIGTVLNVFKSEKAKIEKEQKNGTNKNNNGGRQDSTTLEETLELIGASPRA